MNSLISILTLLFLSCTSEKNYSIARSDIDNLTTVSSDTFKIDCSQPDLTGVIAYSDTVIDYSKNHGHLIKFFDQENRLRHKLITNLYESNSKKIFSTTEIYDTAGHIVYENKTQEMFVWHCYQYTYDNAGRLIEKSGYSSGELGVKVTYVYDNGNLVKEIIERPGYKFMKTY